MSGVAVIRYLLTQSQALTTLVPVAQIMGGDLPINTPRPAISIQQVSSMPRNTVKMNEGKTQHTDRVQVSVLVNGPAATSPGNGYPDVRKILALVLAACPHRRGTLNGFDVDSVLPDVEGPDLSDDATALYSGSRDFIVKWNS